MWKITISGEGSMPLVTTVGDSIVIPPTNPPITIINPPSPVIDNSPFNWPPQPPYIPNYDSTMRYTYLGIDPKAEKNYSQTEWYYNDGLPEYPNPRPQTHLFAGWLANGKRLWAPFKGTPDSIRRVLNGEHP